MKHRTGLIVLFVGLSLAGCAQTPSSETPTSPKTQSAPVQDFTRAVPANSAITLDDFFFANASCEAIEFTLQITRQPTHGRAIIQPSSTTLSAGQAKAGNPSPRCMGRVIASKAVVYQPNDGYAGKDMFEARFTNSREPSRQKTIRYRLLVQ